MTPVGMNSYIATQKMAVNHSDQNPPSVQKEGENNKLLAPVKEQEYMATPAEIEKAIAKVEEKEPAGMIESFTHGLLGMDHPDDEEEVKVENEGKEGKEGKKDEEENTDGSYTAGKFLKGALSVGALLLAIV
ncbi:MAG: hypothetical protein V5786_00275 [Psychromonas sp.]